MRKTQLIMDKLVHLGLPIQYKILRDKFWYDYLEPKYGEKAKLCYMNIYSFIVYIKTDDLYKDIVEDVGTRFDTSNYELSRPLPKGKRKH